MTNINLINRSIQEEEKLSVGLDKKQKKKITIEGLKLEDINISSN
jgi:hypothetical protein